MIKTNLKTCIKNFEACVAEGDKEKAAAVVKNKTEKVKTIKKRIDNMREGPTKEKYLEALRKMDFSVLFLPLISSFRAL